jgi:endo-1,4-beta-xylanase
MLAVPLIAIQEFVIGGQRGVTYAVDTTNSSPTDANLPGQWSYMPGTSLEKGGLRVLDSDFSIVQQDGSGGQANPSVNLLGTRINAGGDFVLKATMSEIQGQATITLYSQAPIIQDEFRVDGPYLSMKVDNNTFTVMVFDGGYQSMSIIQKPSFSKTYTIADPQTKYDLAITHSGEQLSFALNGQKLGSTAERRVLQSRQLWFGADSKNGSWLLSSLSIDPLGQAQAQVAGTAISKGRSKHSRRHAPKKPAAAATTAIGFVDSMSATAKTVNPQGLQSLASIKRPGFLIGAAMALSPMASDPQYAAIALNGNFGSMTTENALKWQFVEPKEGVYDFHESDALVSLAKQHDIKVHGHNLVFSEANPHWVQNLPVATAADKQKVSDVMNDHIKTLVSHFKGQIATWDVVNEPLADYDTFTPGSNELRSNKWLSAMGPGYIAQAFQTAHAADPSAKLFLNDYGLEENGERWDAMIGLIQHLKNQGVPIDGVGFESHVYESGDVINPTVLRQHIRQLASMGILARVSEMDVYDDDGIQIQSQQYGDVFAACLAESNCVSWTTWGVSDRYDMFSDDGKTFDYGNDFLWDSTMKPVPAVARMQQVLN